MSRVCVCVCVCVCARASLTLCEVERRVDQGVQRAGGAVAQRRGEPRDQAGKHAELLPLGVALQRLHPQQEQAHALATDLPGGRRHTGCQSGRTPKQGLRLQQRATHGEHRITSEERGRRGEGERGRVPYQLSR